MNSENLIIKKVNLNDNKVLLNIGRQTFYDAFGPPHNIEKNINDYLDQNFTLDNITQELQNPESEFYFVLFDNEIAGYLKINTGDAQTESVEGITLEIERIYVLKQYQGKKIGQVLFEKAVQIANSKSIKILWLGVWDKNTGAIKFYERNGFKTFDLHQFILGTDIQTDIMMKLTL
ncbi:GNAT family N-acetyltransferase [Aquimarina aquimarini]|uniref:GNAT family N-acetyltransferase n=1 Tax=Aquimarina aquimarini TaxID=1191734 RepID=UPI000D5621A5|nr:GNAT family N-acetyltransferase [Aquimarina aquimarini]